MSERVLESSASQGRAGKHPRSASFLDSGEGWFPPVWTRERKGTLRRVGEEGPWLWSLFEWVSDTWLRAACGVLQVSLQRSRRHWRRRSRRSAGVAVARPWTPLSLSSQISSISAAKALRPSWMMK